MTAPAPPPDDTQVWRAWAAAACSTLATGILVGGVFDGAAASVHAALAGLLGAGAAAGLRRVRNAWLVNLGALVAVFGIGLGVLALTGAGQVGRAVALVTDAVRTGDVLRPPVPYADGWHAVVGWIGGGVGFAAAWVALVGGRPRLALVVPLPVAGLVAISLPDVSQVALGVAALSLVAVGFGVLGDAGVGPTSAAFEIRRVARGVVAIGVAVGLTLALTSVDALFPDPFVDPSSEPQAPDTVPLSEVEDRVLFEVRAGISGPWRLGSLDVYDGRSWLLPPPADTELVSVPRSGIVDPELPQGASAIFRIAALGGAVLPGLPNTVGVAASGPRLEHDRRSGGLRVAGGRVRPGLTYTVTAAPLPDVSVLRNAGDREGVPVPGALRTFVEAPDPPPAVAGLLEQAEAAHDNTWDRFDFVRRRVLDTVVATGTGRPVDVTPARVAELLGGAEGSPFEIVAAQALLARWLGLPSRIGYGFDGGETVLDRRQIRPRHGAAFVEVWFPRHKWLAVVGTPTRARPTVGGEPAFQRFDPDVLPSAEAGVSLFLPVETEPASGLGRAGLLAFLGTIAAALAAGAVFLLWPAARKTVERGRRRSFAMRAGPASRVALAYAEWREAVADFGWDAPGDPPLAYLARVEPDAEHAELAWLVSRVLWGDLEADEETAAAAEELSRSLRSRLSQAHPASARVAASLSRESLRSPALVGSAAGSGPGEGGAGA